MNVFRDFLVTWHQDEGLKLISFLDFLGLLWTFCGTLVDFRINDCTLTTFKKVLHRISYLQNDVRIFEPLKPFLTAKHHQQKVPFWLVFWLMCHDVKDKFTSLYSIVTVSVLEFPKMVCLKMPTSGWVLFRLTLTVSSLIEFKGQKTHKKATKAKKRDIFHLYSIVLICTS